MNDGPWLDNPNTGAQSTDIATVKDVAIIPPYKAGTVPLGSDDGVLVSQNSETVRVPAESVGDSFNGYFTGSVVNIGTFSHGRMVIDNDGITLPTPDRFFAQGSAGAKISATNSYASFGNNAIRLATDGQGALLINSNGATLYTPNGFILPNLPTTDPGVSNRVWAADNAVVLSGFVPAATASLLVSTVTVAGVANVDIALPAGYKSFTLRGREIGAVGSPGLQFRCGFGAGPTFDAANNYGYVGISMRDGASAPHGNAATAATSAALGEFGFMAPGNAPQVASLILEIQNPADTGFYRTFQGSEFGSNGVGSGYFLSQWSNAWLNSTDAMTAIRIADFSGGALISGTFDLYGWK